MIEQQKIEINLVDYQNLVNENKILKERIFELEQQLSDLKRMLFGIKSERFVPQHDGQQTIDFKLEATTPEPKEKETVTLARGKKQIKKQSVRKALPSHLPRIEKVIEPAYLPEGSKKIGELITEILEYTPGKVQVLKIIRPKYVVPVSDNKENQSFDDQKSPIIVAELPSLPIPKGNAGPGLLAHIFVSKFVDHLPFYRQVQMLKRDNIHYIAESTINGWLNQVCRLLQPLYDKLKMKILQSNYIMADESPLPVLTSDNPGSTHQGYHWVYYSPLQKLVYFDYRKGRGREGPLEFFEGYKGSIQTDGYSAYDIFEKNPDIILLACMTHARRKFEHSLENDSVRAKTAMLWFQKLYEIESEARKTNLSFEQRKELRQQKSVPVLNEMETWMQAELPQVLPKSSIGGAISYTLNLWNRLLKYTSDGRYEIDNNLIENSIRPLALGRKNYLFAGSHEGAQRAAMMYSFLGSCKINDVNPFNWLKGVLSVIQDYKANQLNDLLPDNWNNISSKK